MKTTKEAEKQSGLSTHKFRRLTTVLKIIGKKERGNTGLLWTDEQVNVITEAGKIFFKEYNPINELEIVEYYLKGNNIHTVATHFHRSSHTIERIILRYKREKCVFVESKIKEYD